MPVSRLIAKLRALGTHPQALRLLESVLAPRSAVIVAGGQHSREIEMRDMVYQGTVFGPSMWSCHDGDSRAAISATRFEEFVCADAMNALCRFAGAVCGAEIFASMR